MLEQYRAFLNKPPEFVLEWNDSYTPAKGFLVMNTLRGGAAGGGTRMRVGVTKSEVTHLAKTMEIKFAVSGPDIGGAKSGIDFDHTKIKEKEGVLQRWFAFIAQELKTRYGTGGDLNIDHAGEVVPFTRLQGIHHPQEGIVAGHFHLSPHDHAQSLKQLQEGISAVCDQDPFLVEREMTVADMATGCGLLGSLKAFYNLHGDSLQGKRVLVEGFGNVGGAAAYLVEQAGAHVVGVLEKNHYAVSEQGLPIKELFSVRGKGRGLPVHDMVKERAQGEDEFWNIKADIFIPAATSRTIGLPELAKLEKAGVQCIASGANNPFVESSFDSFDVTLNADERFSLIPDFIANCGMARAFAYCMQPGVDVRGHAIANDIAQCVTNAVGEAVGQERRTKGIFQNALNLVAQKLEH